MIKTLPKSQLIITWKEAFGEPFKGNRLDLIKNGCKKVILGELAALNGRLKSNKSNYQDTSFATQKKELIYFSGLNPILLRQFVKLIGFYFQNENNYGLIFTRATCLYAIEEIIQSDLEINEGFTMKDFWYNLFKYLLSINQEIVSFTEKEVKESKNSMEEINPKFIPLNEIAVNTNSLYTALRGFNLLKYLSEHEKIGENLKKYLYKNYQFEYDRFIYELISLYFANNKDGENNIINQLTGESLDTTFYYRIKDKKTLPFFQYLSSSYASNKIERLISIKKYPMYKASEDAFILFDNILALEKCYYQFINDFWFDLVSKITNDAGKLLYTIKDYRSIIGYFFENYTEKVLRHSFTNAKFYSIKFFNELIIKINAKEIELADVYIRYDKKVFLAQVKSTGIYDNEKFAGDTEGLYKRGRDDFYDSFGLKQIINSIRNIELIKDEIDPKFPRKHSYRIFPAIIVNDKAMQTPLMANLFNERFQELFKSHRTKKIHVHPLSIIHISDLEQMEESLNKNPQQFWEIIAYNIRETKFIPPFYNTLNRLKIKPDYSNAKELFKQLIYKFNPELLDCKYQQN